MSYPAFVSSFTAAVRGAEPETAVAAVAAAVTAADAAATVPPTTMLRKRQKSLEPARQE